MDRVFVIPCKYSDTRPFIYNCIQSIRKYHDDTIIVVDSDSDDKSYFDVLKNGFEDVIIEDIANKNYMTGAVWYAYEKYKAKNYYFLHDSTELLGNISEYDEYDVTPVIISNSVDRWKWPKIDKSGTEVRNPDWSKSKVEEHTNLKFKLSDFRVIVGPMFLCKVDVLKKLKEIGFDKILPENKSGMEHMERLFGLVFEHFGYRDMIEKNALLNSRNDDGHVAQNTLHLLNMKTNEYVAIKNVLKCNQQDNDKIIKYWTGRQ
tara:strand:- start:434 stop:1216 length:783 start_codon:yes stop_codon:yes gene_type:complete